MESTQKPIKAMDRARLGGATDENTTGYMKRTRPTAKTIIAKEAVRIRCISRCSRFAKERRSKKCIMASPLELQILETLKRHKAAIGV
jgi:hypothetical protein